jgi:hypothetical protein
MQLATETIIPKGPFMHLQKGLIVLAPAALDLEMKLVSEKFRLGDVINEIIGVIWPSTTASTYVTFPGIDAWRSPFHQIRLNIAAGQ